uniref:Uncharacterized protein n=1 Tax=Caulobacter phage S2L TaxID=3348356 RepID=A0AB74ULU1_9VIRU
MDARYGEAWRHRPMLRSPEWAQAWEEAGRAPPEDLKED